MGFEDFRAKLQEEKGKETESPDYESDLSDLNSEVLSFDDKEESLFIDYNQNVIDTIGDDTLSSIPFNFLEIDQETVSIKEDEAIQWVVDNYESYQELSWAQVSTVFENARVAASEYVMYSGDATGLDGKSIADIQDHVNQIKKPVIDTFRVKNTIGFRKGDASIEDISLFGDTPEYQKEILFNVLQVDEKIIEDSTKRSVEGSGFQWLQGEYEKGLQDDDPLALWYQHIFARKLDDILDSSSGGVITETYINAMDSDDENIFNYEVLPDARQSEVQYLLEDTVLGESLLLYAKYEHFSRITKPVYDPLNKLSMMMRVLSFDGDSPNMINDAHTLSKKIDLIYEPPGESYESINTHILQIQALGQTLLSLDTILLQESLLDAIESEALPDDVLTQLTGKSAEILQETGVDGHVSREDMYSLGLSEGLLSKEDALALETALDEFQVEWSSLIGTPDIQNSRYCLQHLGGLMQADDEGVPVSPTVFGRDEDASFTYRLGDIEDQNRTLILPVGPDNNGNYQNVNLSTVERQSVERTYNFHKNKLRETWRTQLLPKVDRIKSLLNRNADTFKQMGDNDTIARLLAGTDSADAISAAGIEFTDTDDKALGILTRRSALEFVEGLKSIYPDKITKKDFMELFPGISMEIRKKLGIDNRPQVGFLGSIFTGQPSVLDFSNYPDGEIVLRARNSFEKIGYFFKEGKWWELSKEIGTIIIMAILERFTGLSKLPWLKRGFAFWVGMKSLRGGIETTEGLIRGKTISDASFEGFGKAFNVFEKNIIGKPLMGEDGEMIVKPVEKIITENTFEAAMLMVLFTPGWRVRVSKPIEARSRRVDSTLSRGLLQVTGEAGVFTAIDNLISSPLESAIGEGWSESSREASWDARKGAMEQNLSMNHWLESYVGNYMFVGAIKAGQYAPKGVQNMYVNRFVKGKQSKLLDQSAQQHTQVENALKREGIERGVVDGKEKFYRGEKELTHDQLPSDIKNMMVEVSKIDAQIVKLQQQILNNAGRLTGHPIHEFAQKNGLESPLRTPEGVIQGRIRRAQKKLDNAKTQAEKTSAEKELQQAKDLLKDYRLTKEHYEEQVANKGEVYFDLNYEQNHQGTELANKLGYRAADGVLVINEAKRRNASKAEQSEFFAHEHAHLVLLGILPGQLETIERNFKGHVLRAQMKQYITEYHGREKLTDVQIVNELIADYLGRKEHGKIAGQGIRNPQQFDQAIEGLLGTYMWFTGFDSLLASQKNTSPLYNSTTLGNAAFLGIGRTVRRGVTGAAKKYVWEPAKERMSEKRKSRFEQVGTALEAYQRGHYARVKREMGIIDKKMQPYTEKISSIEGKEGPLKEQLQKKTQDVQRIQKEIVELKQQKLTLEEGVVKNATEQLNKLNKQKEKLESQVREIELIIDNVQRGRKGIDYLKTKGKIKTYKTQRKQMKALQKEIKEKQQEKEQANSFDKDGVFQEGLKEQRQQAIDNIIEQKNTIINETITNLEKNKGSHQASLQGLIENIQKNQSIVDQTKTLDGQVIEKGNTIEQLLKEKQTIESELSTLETEKNAEISSKEPFEQQKQKLQAELEKNMFFKGRDTILRTYGVKNGYNPFTGKRSTGFDGRWQRGKGIQERVSNVRTEGLGKSMMQLMQYLFASKEGRGNILVSATNSLKIRVVSWPVYGAGMLFGSDIDITSVNWINKARLHMASYLPWILRAIGTLVDGVGSGNRTGRGYVDRVKVGTDYYGLPEYETERTGRFIERMYEAESWLDPLTPPDVPFDLPRKGSVDMRTMEDSNKLPAMLIVRFVHLVKQMQKADPDNFPADAVEELEGALDQYPDQDAIEKYRELIKTAEQLSDEEVEWMVKQQQETRNNQPVTPQVKQRITKPAPTSTNKPPEKSIDPRDFYKKNNNQ